MSVARGKFFRSAAIARAPWALGESIEGWEEKRPSFTSGLIPALVMEYKADKTCAMREFGL